MKAKILTFSSHGDTTLLEYDPVSLAKTLADRKINSLQQYFQSLIWYNPMPCSACFSSGSEH